MKTTTKYKHAIEIWDEIVNNHEPNELEEKFDNMCSEFLEKVHSLSFEELQNLAEQYLKETKILKHVAAEMENKATYASFLAEIIWVAAFEYNI